MFRENLCLPFIISNTRIPEPDKLAEHLTIIIIIEESNRTTLGRIWWGHAGGCWFRGTISSIIPENAFKGRLLE